MPALSLPSLGRKMTSALSKFKHSDHQSLLPLQTCKSMKEFMQIHAHIVRKGEISDTFVATKLLEFCALAGNMNYARRIFDLIDRPSTYTWTTMIRGFVVIRFPEKAIEFYHRMMLLGFKPNNFTFLFMLKAYSLTEAHPEGTIVHGKLLRTGLHLDVFLHNALVHIYSKCGDINAARQVFDEMPNNNAVFTWNAMLSGYFDCGDIKGARQWFDKMTQRNVATWNAAISGSSSCGHVDLARSFFDAMPERDFLSWSAMITSYTQSRQAAKALDLFQGMQLASVKPDNFTIASVLSACSQIGALDMGKWLHVYINKEKLRDDVVLGTSLVDMYAKCGCIDMALQVFHGMPYRNQLSWNAMLCGLAMHGLGDDALALFARMEFARVRPSDVTFVGVLCACSHIGSVDEGRRQFDRMCKEFKIFPKIEHYGCMVDLLGRAGLLEEAKELIQNMTVKPNIVIWGALLSACRIHGNVGLSEHVVKHILKLAPTDLGCYVLLSNIYATRKQWDGVVKMRKLMGGMGARKVPGCSSIEVSSVVHEFLVGDKSHAKWKEIFEALDRLSTHLEDEGYMPNSSLLMYDIDEELV